MIQLGYVKDLSSNKMYFKIRPRNKQTKKYSRGIFDLKSGCHGNFCANEKITMQITYNCQLKY